MWTKKRKNARHQPEPTVIVVVIRMIVEPGNGARIVLIVDPRPARKPAPKVDRPAGFPAPTSVSESRESRQKNISSHRFARDRGKRFTEQCTARTVFSVGGKTSPPGTPR